MKSLIALSAFLVSFYKLSGQNFIDTIQYFRIGDIYIKTYDENAVLRLDCQYSGDDVTKLLSETVYLPNGKEFSKSIWYWHGFEQNIFRLDSVTGKTNFMEIDSSGNVLEISQCSDTISDSWCKLFFSNGKLKADGFRRMEKVFLVESLDSFKIGAVVENQQFDIDEVNSGIWHYYYQNGRDSALGSYYPISYQSEKYFLSDSIHACDPQIGEYVYCLALSERNREIKTGTWQYFSPEGKLICTEEWDKGTLMVRQNY